MKYIKENLQRYIKECFINAFKSENREYSDKLWSFEYIMIKNSSGIYQLYPIMWCKFTRVLYRVHTMLQKNLMKNFGINYRDTDKMRCLVYSSGQIDFNFTQAMFHTKEGNLSLSVFDKNTNIYENGLEGECMPAYTYEKLLFKYWNLDAKSYMKLSKNDERNWLPNILQKDWDAFKTLYNETFNIPIGNYDIICSSGIEQI